VSQVSEPSFFASALYFYGPTVVALGVRKKEFTISMLSLYVDPLDDEVGLMLKDMSAYATWCKARYELRDGLVSKMSRARGSVMFDGHCWTYRISYVGESMLMQLPKNRRGHLSGLSGKLIRLVCIGSGSYNMRFYVAAPYRSTGKIDLKSYEG